MDNWRRYGDGMQAESQWDAVADVRAMRDEDIRISDEKMEEQRRDGAEGPEINEVGRALLRELGLTVR
jgi:hypothetical protein